jgi:hypothetical protein
MPATPSHGHRKAERAVPFTNLRKGLRVGLMFSIVEELESLPDGPAEHPGGALVRSPAPILTSPGRVDAGAAVSPWLGRIELVETKPVNPRGPLAKPRGIGGQTRVVWHPEVVALLESLWPRHSASEIAAKIPGATRSGVCGKAHRLKLAQKPSMPIGFRCPPTGKVAGGEPLFWQTPERKEILFRMRGEGRSAVEIADALGTSKSAVKAAIRRYRVPLGAAPRREPSGAAPKLVSVNHSAVKLVSMPNPKLDASLNVTIFDLEAHHCRWPVEDDARGNIVLYCGNGPLVPQPNGCPSAYCRIHAGLAYVPIRGREQERRNTYLMKIA